MLEQAIETDVGLSNFELDQSVPPRLENPAPAVGSCIFAYFLFETKIGRGRGIVNLVPADDSGSAWKAYTFYTSLQELKGHEEHWPVTLDEDDPLVLVIGAGQCGLALAARLCRLNISTIVIEKNQRVGDNWRNRYKSYASLFFNG